MIIIVELTFYKFCSIPFSVDELSRSMVQIDIADVEPPPLIRESSGFSFLSPSAK